MLLIGHYSVLYEMLSYILRSSKVKGILAGHTVVQI